MGSKGALYLTDVTIVVLGILIIMALRKTALGVRLGRLLMLINLGIIAIALNHVLATLFVHEYFEGRLILGAAAPDVIHHAGNLLGFALIFWGYFLADRTYRRAV